MYDGILASAATGPIDVFTVANAVWTLQNRGKGETSPLFEWRVESPDGEPVRTASGQTMNVDGPINARTTADAIMVLGPYVGGGTARFISKIEVLQPLLQPLMTALRRQYERGALITSVCSGSFVLAETGLLDGRMATTHWSLAEAFQQRYPQVDLRANEVVTEQNRILCSGAVTSYFNLALRLVEKFAGASLAVATAKMLLIDTNRISQASYKTLTVQDQQSHSDRLVARAQIWMEKHLQESFRLADLASYLAVSERTLNRRFKLAIGETPLSHLQSLRIELAKRLLETTGLNIEAISERVGYGDLSTFRRLFKRETALSPREYQQRFARRKYVRTLTPKKARPNPAVQGTLRDKTAQRS